MQRFFILLFTFVSIAIFIGCTDSPEKILSPALASVMRVEPSDCLSCNRCVNDFQCPREAISIDKNMPNKAIIDPEKCVLCKLCDTDFKCPYNAIKDYDDVIAPSAPLNFILTDSTQSVLTMSFDQAYDDFNSTNGFAYAASYLVKADTVDNFNFSSGFTVYNGKDSFQQTDIDSLFNKPLKPGTAYYFQAVAYDEVGNVSSPARLKASTLPLKKGVK